MKSRCIHLAWIISLVAHVCLAVVVAYIAISSKAQIPRDTIDVSFFIVAPPQASQRDLIPKPQVVVTAPVPDLQVAPQTATTARRSVVAREVTSSLSPAPTTLLMAGNPAAPRREQVNVLGAVPVNHNAAQVLSTAAEVPIESDTLPTTGLRSGGSIADGIGTGIGEGLGTGTGRGAFGSGTGVAQARASGTGLNSLVEDAGVANISASLSEVTENIVLGNGVPPLPKGTPGAIIQGRGKEILGRLNLVRLDDPLHPNLDI